MEQEIAKLHEMSKAAQEAAAPSFTPPALKPLIDIEDVKKVDLRIGQILSAVPVPKSKKLLKLEVDLGFEKRTIVAGISLFFKPEELVGKKIVIVANLKPATLMGVESQGMVLAGSTDTALELPGIQNLPAGSIVA